MRKTIAFVPLLAVLLTACNHGSDVVGKWSVAPDYIQAHSNMKPEGFMTGFASTFWYDLKKDNTFQGSMSEGTYKVEGSKITITTTKLMGTDVAKIPGNQGKTGIDMTGEFSADGKSLTLHPPSNGLLPTELGSGIKMQKESS
ncbi:MAG: hypothetical protein JST51_17255 [Armatimonadetes bacterium]|nr:hypothetical protein [Armatimonadota bacterium]